MPKTEEITDNEMLELQMKWGEVKVEKDREHGEAFGHLTTRYQMLGKAVYDLLPKLLLTIHVLRSRSARLRSALMVQANAHNQRMRRGELCWCAVGYNVDALGHSLGCTVSREALDLDPPDAPLEGLDYVHKVEVHFVINDRVIQELDIKSLPPWSTDRQMRFAALANDTLRRAVVACEEHFKATDEACTCFAKERSPNDPLKNMHGSECACWESEEDDARF